jgi:hypothetical protein
MPPPYAPKYVSPKQAAEDRARRRAALYWAVLAMPLIVMLLVFGYSDQAPVALRSATITLDQTLVIRSRDCSACRSRRDRHGIRRLRCKRQIYTTERTMPPSTRRSTRWPTAGCEPSAARWSGWWSRRPARPALNFPQQPRGPAKRWAFSL